MEEENIMQKNKNRERNKQIFTQWKNLLKREQIFTKRKIYKKGNKKEKMKIEKIK
jgi:hypothetical protein